jgi:hypothetical protein
VRDRTSLPPALVDLVAVPLLHTHQRVLLGKALAQEVQLLGQLGYKNSNQHRSSLHWRKYQQVRRLLKRWTVNDVAGVLDALLAIMHPTARNKHSQHVWTCLPHPRYLAHCQARLYAAFVLCEKLLHSYQECFVAFQAIAAQTYFLPLALGMMACMARCHAWSLAQRTALMETYAALQQWRALLPTSAASSMDVPAYAQDLPVRLRSELGATVLAQLTLPLLPQPALIVASELASISEGQEEPDDAVMSELESPQHEIGTMEAGVPTTLDFFSRTSHSPGEDDANSAHVSLESSSSTSLEPVPFSAPTLALDACVTSENGSTASGHTHRIKVSAKLKANLLKLRKGPSTSEPEPASDNTSASKRPIILKKAILAKGKRAQLTEATGNPKPRPAKRSKQADEIDDIFGGL